MISRRSARGQSLISRVRAFFSRAPKHLVDELPNVEEPHWEAEDHLESLAVDPLVVDPWGADAALDTEAPKGPSNQQNNLKRSPRSRVAASANERHARSDRPIFEPISPPIAQREFRLSAPTLRAESHPLTEPTMRVMAAENSQDDPCHSGAADVPSEPRVPPLFARRYRAQS
jgi:hypothetical protein